MWTAERVERLTTLWTANKLSSVEIAEEIGGGLTRNAVIGKARRLNLLEKGRGRGQSERQPRERIVKVRTKRNRVPPEPPAQPSPPLNIPYLDIQPHHCREIVGSGENGLPLSCGHLTHDIPCPDGSTWRSSYCAWHHSINYMKPREKVRSVPHYTQAHPVFRPEYELHRIP